MAGAPKLIVLSEQFRGKVFELTKDTYSIGRVDARDICLKDPSISSYHADLIRKDNTYILRDHGSTNGSRVNNEPITEKELKSTDMIQLGGIEILFDSEDKTGTREIKTMTKIDITSTGIATSTLKRLENVRQSKPKTRNVTQILILIILIFLVIIVIAGLGTLFYLLFTQKPSAQQPPAQAPTNITAKSE